MLTQRSMLLVLLTFATALGALAVAATSAWLRCGRGSECSSDLAFAIVAIAPASLIGCLAVLLLRTKARSSWIRALLLAFGVGVAVMPLGAFLLRDARVLPIFAALAAAAVLLVLWEDSGDPEREPTRTPQVAPSRGASPRAAPAPGAIGQPHRPAARVPAQQALGVLHEVAAFNDEIIRFCELLDRLDPAPRRPGRRTPRYR